MRAHSVATLAYTFLFITHSGTETRRSVCVFVCVPLLFKGGGVGAGLGGGVGPGPGGGVGGGPGGGVGGGPEAGPGGGVVGVQAVCVSPSGASKAAAESSGASVEAEE